MIADNDKEFEHFRYFNRTTISSSTIKLLFGTVIWDSGEDKRLNQHIDICCQNYNIKPVFTKLTGLHLMCQIFINDLLTEQGQQRSRVMR